MNKKFLLISALIIALVVGLAFYYRDKTLSVEVPIADNSPIVYTNTQYGFNFTLPDNWEGYTIIQSTWEGVSLKNGAAESGTKLLIRHPKWTEAAPYEDLPVLVFTTSQWDSYVAENFTVSAAPIQATKLASNNVYVFALPPRWDFDYSLDYEEAQDIIAGKPLQAFDVEDTTKSDAKLNINVVCEQALTYMTFENATTADAFVADCKEGKHPEVIEKYKSDLNLGAGVAI